MPDTFPHAAREVAGPYLAHDTNADTGRGGFSEAQKKSTM